MQKLTFTKEDLTFWLSRWNGAFLRLVFRSKLSAASDCRGSKMRKLWGWGALEGGWKREKRRWKGMTNLTNQNQLALLQRGDDRIYAFVTSLNLIVVAVCDGLYFWSEFCTSAKSLQLVFSQVVIGRRFLWGWQLQWWRHGAGWFGWDYCWVGRVVPGMYVGVEEKVKLNLSKRDTSSVGILSVSSYFRNWNDCLLKKIVMSSYVFRS